MINASLTVGAYHKSTPTQETLTMLISQNIPTAHAGHQPPAFDASLAGAPGAPTAAPANGNAAAANRGEQVALTARAEAIS